jgi:hypothetical protein
VADLSTIDCLAILLVAVAVVFLFSKLRKKQHQQLEKKS